jgi:hypothetical protein
VDPRPLPAGRDAELGDPPVEVPRSRCTAHVSDRTAGWTDERGS